MAYFDKHIFICTNNRPAEHPRGSCAARGGEELVAGFKQALRAEGLHTQVRANKAGCLDTCECGPSVVVYPDGVWYQKVTPEDVAEIVEKHIKGGSPVERLILPRSE